VPNDYGMNYFELGYKDKKVTGRHVFTLDYTATGMVLPRGVRLQAPLEVLYR